MKYKQLMEEFFDYGKHNGHAFSTYKNPTKADLSNLFKEELELFTSYYTKMAKEVPVRFVADIRNKNFYVYSEEYLHHMFMDQILKINKTSNNEDFFYGIGILYKPSYEIKFRNSLDFSNENEFIEKLKINDLDFIKKYIVNFNEIIDAYVSEYVDYINYAKKNSKEERLEKIKNVKNNLRAV